MQFGNIFIRFDRSRTARLSNRMTSIFESIQWSIDRKQPFPVVIQIYSCIDVCGSIETKNGYVTRSSFKSWASSYLLKAKSLPCDETELYYARCGILHTMRPDAKNKPASAREIVYGFINFDNEIRGIKDPTKHVGVYVEDLFEALVIGYENFAAFLESSSDPTIDINLKNLPEYRDVIPIKFPRS